MCVCCSVGSDSLPPHGIQPARLLCPCSSPGKNILFMKPSRAPQGPHKVHLLSILLYFASCL